MQTWRDIIPCPTLIHEQAVAILDTLAEFVQLPENGSSFDRIKEWIHNAVTDEILSEKEAKNLMLALTRGF